MPPVQTVGEDDDDPTSRVQAASVAAAAAADVAADVATAAAAVAGERYTQEIFEGRGADGDLLLLLQRDGDDDDGVEG